MRPLLKVPLGDLKQYKNVYQIYYEVNRLLCRLLPRTVHQSFAIINKVSLVTCAALRRVSVNVAGDERGCDGMARHLQHSTRINCVCVCVCVFVNMHVCVWVCVLVCRGGKER